MKRLVLGLSGASGAPYAQRLIEVLRRGDLGQSVELALVLSRTAETVWEHECGVSPRALGVRSLLRLQESRVFPMWNGPLECALMRFDMVAGSNRREHRRGAAERDVTAFADCRGNEK